MAPFLCQQAPQGRFLRVLALCFMERVLDLTGKYIFFSLKGVKKLLSFAPIMIQTIILPYFVNYFSGSKVEEVTLN